MEVDLRATGVHIGLECSVASRSEILARSFLSVPCSQWRQCHVFCPPQQDTTGAGVLHPCPLTWPEVDFHFLSSILVLCESTQNVWLTSKLTETHTVLAKDATCGGTSLTISSQEAETNWF